jgi:hypothetical protein
MFRSRTGLIALNVKSESIIISQWLRAYVLTFVLALACVAVAGPAFARTVYDGGWSVLIVTNGGACEPNYRFGLQIFDGVVLKDGGSLATVQGRVSRSGAVRVIVRAGSQWAYGSGRLSRNRGGGIWKGQGTSGTCDGTWVAERRG